MRLDGAHLGPVERQPAVSADGLERGVVEPADRDAAHGQVRRGTRARQPAGDLVDQHPLHDLVGQAARRGCGEVGSRQLRFELERAVAARRSGRQAGIGRSVRSTVSATGSMTPGLRATRTRCTPSRAGGASPGA